MSEGEGEAPGALCWRYRPGAGHPTKVAVVIAVALCVGFAGFVAFRNLLPAFVGVGVILGSTAEYWLGTNYALDERGAKSRCGLSVTAIAWSEVKRVALGRGSVKLSPLPAESRMDAFRGLTLRFEEGFEAPLLAFVRLRVNRDVAILG